MIRRNNSDAAEKMMSIELDTPDFKTALISFDCSGVGLVSASPVVNAEGAAETRVEVYVERMTLGGAGSQPAAAPDAATGAPTDATTAAPAAVPAVVPKAKKRPAPVTAQPRYEVRPRGSDD